MAKVRPTKFRNRNVETIRVPASSLVRHPLNPNSHPDGQREVMRSILGEIGFVGSLVVWRDESGALRLIDGEMRSDEMGEQPVDVTVVDLTEEEAAKLLAVYDPVGAMVAQDQAKLDELLKDIEAEDSTLQKMLDELAGEPMEDADTVLKQIETKPPPKMTWCLVGLPTVRWGEIAQKIEGLAAVDGIALETTSNDG